MVLHLDGCVYGDVELFGMRLSMLRGISSEHFEGKSLFHGILKSLISLLCVSLCLEVRLSLCLLAPLQVVLNCMCLLIC